jgi:hypothetical protein
VNGHSPNQALVGGASRFSLGDLGLPLHCTANRIDRTGEFEEQTVSHCLEEASPVPRGDRFDDRAALLAQPRQRALLSQTNEPTEPCNIGAKHRCEATLHLQPPVSTVA